MARSKKTQEDGAPTHDTTPPKTTVKMVLDLPITTHRKVKSNAALQGVSLSAYVSELLEKAQST